MEQENSPQQPRKIRKHVSESLIGTIIASIVVIALLTVAGYYFLNKRITQVKDAQQAALLQMEELRNFATTTVIYQATTTASASATPTCDTSACSAPTTTVSQ